jgi:formylglycine-generating enzyme required for sulfatase activity
MAGNVWEWTSTPAPDGGHVMRGGGWNMAGAEYLLTTSRDVGDRLFRGPSTGLRCVE